MAVAGAGAENKEFRLRHTGFYTVHILNVTYGALHCCGSELPMPVTFRIIKKIELFKIVIFPSFFLFSICLVKIQIVLFFSLFFVFYSEFLAIFLKIRYNLLELILVL